MKKTSRSVITGIVTAIILLVAFVSCGNLNSGKNSSIIVQLDVARSAQLYQKSDVSYYIVTIAPDPNGEGEVRFDRTKTSHAFEGLPSGKYTITVKAYNESNILVAEGSDEDIEVIPGETATAVVEMEVKTYHVHDFATEWTTDAAYHWHAATCGDTDEVQDKAEHTFGDWITVTPATEENEGLKKQVCSICNYEETETIPLLNHTHTWADEWTHDESNHWLECTSSKCSEIDQFAEHDWGVWNVTKEPSEISDGEKQHTCTKCGYIEKAPYYGPRTATYQFTETVQSAPEGYIGTMGSAGETVSYVIFGDFPQTIAGTDVSFNPRPEENGYYVGSDGCYYEKVLENALGTSHQYSDGSYGKEISDSSYRYFKVEPIVWCVVTKDYNGDSSATDALLVAENSITSGIEFYESESDHRNGTPANDYENSQIRAFLNGISYNAAAEGNESKWVGKGFLQTAFTTNGRLLINDTIITDTNNISEKVFLLSYEEATLYFKNSNVQKRSATDYDIANYIAYSNKDDPRYFLRTKGQNSTNNAVFKSSGSSYGLSGVLVTGNSLGIVPAITVPVSALPEQ